MKPAVIVVGGTPSAIAVKNATSTIPVVFISVAEPDGRGFVASLARPGGNMTGTSFRAGAMNTKVMEAVRATNPAVRRVAMLDPMGDPVMIGRRPIIQKRYESMGFAHPLALLFENARRIAELALARRLVFVGPRRLYADAGALLSYDNDLIEEYRVAAGFVHRILKGAKPGDLPVEQPDVFQLVLNLRTAKTLGIKFSQSLATEVIE